MKGNWNVEMDVTAVTYTCTYDEVDLYIIDHTTHTKFDSDYNRSYFEDAIDALY